MATKIVYTKTDEAPALATLSLFPIICFFVKKAGIEIEIKDISLAGRILAQFSEKLTPDRKVSDALSELGNLVKTHHANIIKLPNISASVPQLKEAVEELQSQGYDIPDYPEKPQNEEQRKIKSRYSKILGSAVNPVLREGNSDRRVARAVKNYARNNPHKMGAWNQDSKTHVSSMDHGDFYGSEKSLIMTDSQTLSIRLKKCKGGIHVLKESLPVLAGDVIDGAMMSCKALSEFFREQMKDAREKGVLFSIHLKATMMKVSDPVIFGEAVKIFFEPVFTKHKESFDRVGVDPRYGLGDLLEKIKNLPADVQSEIKRDMDKCMTEGPSPAMVDSDKGKTCFHVPSDVIIDASMPAAIRHSGQMWNSDGKLQDMKAVIPDRSYAGIYQKTIEFCKTHGAFDPKTMGSVSNLGLMAKKAEEYGSHDKTFRIQDAGSVEVIDSSGKVLMEHSVEEGDLWRMCHTRDEAIVDWVNLAVHRAKTTAQPALFWLDPDRPHDANLIKKVKACLENHDTQSLFLEILSLVEAMEKTLHRVKGGQDVISVTGNVLRDYLTDLFPILELGTSAKMLSIVPLLAGGGLFETGAGGSAPKHMDQFIKENHLRWDSLGEFLALAASLEHIAEKDRNLKAGVLAETLNQANEEFLRNNKSPSRKVMELDSRGSHFYLALYWARALADQNQDMELKREFNKLANNLKVNEKEIIEGMNSIQGQPVDMAGYYRPNIQKLEAIMRPSQKFNRTLENQ